LEKILSDFLSKNPPSGNLAKTTVMGAKLCLELGNQESLFYDYIVAYGMSLDFICSL